MIKLISIIYFFILRLRYKFDISGLEKIEKNKQYIILPNHQALVDPQIVVSLVGQKIKVSPLMSETYYNLPILKYFFIWIGAVSIGDIQRGTGNKESINKSFDNIKLALDEGKNILLYPSGQLYSQGFESIKGKKIAYNLTQILPDNVEIILIKTTGLRGSIFSKAWSGKTPNLILNLIKSFFILLGNIFFLIPKRKVKIEIENYTNILKNTKNINDYNQKLEEFYNKDGEEKVNYKKHFFYFNNTKNKELPLNIDGAINCSLDNQDYDLQKIDEKILNKIIKKIAEIKEIKEDNINIKSSLINDLYFDSLDLAEIKSFVQNNFKLADNPSILDLKTVLNLYIMAIGESQNKEELKDCNWIQTNNKEEKLFDIIQNNSNKLKNNVNILNLFKEVFKKDKKESFVYDEIFGIQSKKDFLIKVYLISSYIKKFDGKYIGLMLPSVSSASLLIISTILAGKVPVMLNWTLGESALLHCIKFAQINTVLTSKKFYEKIQNDGTEKIKDKYVFLENLLKDIKLISKIKALFNSMFFKIPEIKSEDEAVMLFTSGSESLPKAVVLTHKNIISDINGALYHFPITNKDKLIGFLPPFHSFGFSVNTIMPLISGLKVLYTPDPNDIKTVGNLIGHGKITALSATPTFLNMILKDTNEEKLKSLKYAVVGAEKCNENVFELFDKKCPNGKILEGYGITECSPVISINPPIKSKKGSVGLAIYGGDVKIVGLENKKILGNNKEGMIYFKGDNVFAGYLDKNLENPFENIDGKLYYKTGDLGYLDKDGYIYITGRLKRFIKIAGEMISLPFVESILNKKYGNSIAIEALEKDGQAKIVLFSTENINLEQAQDFLRQNGVSNLVKLSETMIIDELPVLGTGKIDYKILKKMIK
ncbi:AMP-binding protein [Candidatus Vampirococcus lugosii]|uniref:Acyl-CoA synthetase (AMP-forming)/AMP-acid ligase II n=1 Tax=Candidatus Vampirococcus lugosii TaxID=2789015 RepID=A0ABS5QNC0_9BACT|nr:AMP-binding protein [Candidatus Vampirococcus lugosii]MBS8122166.1 Acyl-CoA synthetase (AMP-forming)/AMP-acid ligase II [Candidatus Vampirococcus lugosii]